MQRRQSAQIERWTNGCGRPTRAEPRAPRVAYQTRGAIGASPMNVERWSVRSCCCMIFPYFSVYVQQ